MLRRGQGPVRAWRWWEGGSDLEAGVSSARSGPLQIRPCAGSRPHEPRLAAQSLGSEACPAGEPQDGNKAENPQFEYPGREPGKGRWWEFLATRRVSSPPILTSLLSIGAHPGWGFRGPPWPPQNSSFQPGEPWSFLPAGNGASGGELLPFPAQPQAPHHQRVPLEASPLRTPTHRMALLISWRTGWV